MDIPTPDFDVFEEQILDVVLRQRGEANAYRAQIRDAKARAYFGYIENALRDPDAYPTTTVPGLIGLALEWSESDWIDYLR